jgi:hypothetical protein
VRLPQTAQSEGRLPQTAQSEGRLRQTAQSEGRQTEYFKLKKDQEIFGAQQVLNYGIKRKEIQ